jgi:hypothetical protein
MTTIKTNLVILSSAIVLFLGACGNTETSKSNTNSTETSANASPSKTSGSANKTEEKQHDSPSKGGQVIESGAYHMEFVPVKESGGVHLDFYLQKGDNHEPIPNAKIMAQIQLPDGTSKILNLTYKATEKHYAALLPETSDGQYQVKIVTTIDGKKIDGRFSFNN